MGMGLLGPALLGTGLDAGGQAGGGGLLTARVPGGTDGLCAWVTNDLGTDVLAPPVAEARAWVGLGTRADVVAR